MRVSVTVTDDAGNVFQGEVDLATVSGQKAARKKSPTAKDPAMSRTVNLQLPIRAFIKKYAGDMGGPQKFALLVGYLTKGGTAKQVALSEIEKNWNKMKPLMGGRFNLAYTTRAKDNGWVDSPKRGAYVILPEWKGIFNA